MLGVWKYRVEIKLRLKLSVPYKTIFGQRKGGIILFLNYKTIIITITNLPKLLGQRAVQKFEWEFNNLKGGGRRRRTFVVVILLLQWNLLCGKLANRFCKLCKLSPPRFVSFVYISPRRMRKWEKWKESRFYFPCQLFVSLSLSTTLNEGTEDSLFVCLGVSW